MDTSCDVWSLGCIYLEFLAWFFGGWQYVDRFLDSRLARDNVFWGVDTSTFFLPCENDEAGGTPEPKSRRLSTRSVQFASWKAPIALNSQL